MPDETPISAFSKRSSGAKSPALAKELAQAKAELLASQGEVQELRKAARAAAEREQLLAEELQHRVRNMLAVLRSIYRRSLESGASQNQFPEHFGGRLDAIARYQADISDILSKGVNLKDMVREELLGVQCNEGPRCTIVGPLVHLRHKCGEMMGLAIHELTTNAVKFGALSSGGTISVRWSLTGSKAAPVLRFRWKETGVPLLSAAPRSQGFGQDLIEQALPYQLGATTSFEFKPGGVDCSIVLPLPPSATRQED